MDRANARSEHLRSQNAVLELTLEDSKSTTDRLSVLLGKLESNNTALHLAQSYCDHIIESYDVLVALLETETGLLSVCNNNGLGGYSNGGLESSNVRRRAASNRKSAEVVARHLLARMGKSFNRSDSGVGGVCSVASSSSYWEDSSGYSHTASSSSTTSSAAGIGDGGGGDHAFSKAEEARLKDHISALKTVRASVQNSVVETEPLHSNPDLSSPNCGKKNNNSDQVDLELAVIQQELMAGREEKADLRAKVYLLEKEKASQDLAISDRISLEHVLRTHVQHLQEELGQMERGPHARHIMMPQNQAQLRQDSGRGRESVLKERVENLLGTLDKVTKNSETKQGQANDLIEDLKRANR